MDTFDEMYLLDLHGNSRKKERTPEGGKDENVFDIQQGVAVGLFVKRADGGPTVQLACSTRTFGVSEKQGRDGWQVRMAGRQRCQNLLNGRQLTPMSPRNTYSFREMRPLPRSTRRRWGMADVFPANWGSSSRHCDNARDQARRSQWNA